MWACPGMASSYHRQPENDKESEVHHSKSARAPTSFSTWKCNANLRACFGKDYMRTGRPALTRTTFGVATVSTHALPECRTNQDRACPSRGQATASIPSGTSPTASLPAYQSTSIGMLHAWLTTKAGRQRSLLSTVTARCPCSLPGIS
jgi:hypothetical protein